MITTDIRFELPLWVLKGIKSGIYTRAGGVFRDNAGQIVLMLQEVARRAPRGRLPGKAGLAVAGTVVLAGGSYAVYRMLTKKGQLRRRTAALQKHAVKYSIAASEGVLTADELSNLSHALNQLMNYLQATKTKEVPLALNQETRERLNQFFDSLVDFNTKIALAESLGESPPQPEAGESDHSLLAAIEQQLAYQLPLLDDGGVGVLH